MLRVAVGLRVDGDGGDAELVERADDADRDLAAVGDQDLGEHAARHAISRAARYAPRHERGALPGHRRERLHRRVGGRAAGRRGHAGRRARRVRRRPPPAAACSTTTALAALARVRGDITDLDALERTLDEHAITHVIHLAALQVPFCRADPPLGARVNVVGTVNVFEAAARRADRIGPGRLRLLGRRVRRARGGRDRRRDAGRPEHALRRLQARERGDRDRLRGRARRRAASGCARTPSTGRGATRASRRRRRSRCSRPPRAGPTSCRSAAPTSSSTRPTSPPRSSPPRAGSPTAPSCATSAARPSTPTT